MRARAGIVCIGCVFLGGLSAWGQEGNPSETPLGEGEGDSEAAAKTRFQAIVQGVLDHIKKVDAVSDRLKVPEFPKGKEWFNSAPLTFAKELRGKVTVLDFWTYCCINCIHVLPDLAWLEAKYANYPVAFVGVHSAKFDNEKVSENVRNAILRYEILHPVINDDEMGMWREIGVRSWPTLVVVGPKGNLLLMVSGEGQRDILDAAITGALQFYPAEAFRHDPVPLALERGKTRHASPLRYPGKLAVDPVDKRLFISDSNHNRIVVTDLDGMFLEAIGSGRMGLRDGSFAEAEFNRLQGLAFHNGKLYVADAENHALRLVDLGAKTVSTLAGNGTQGRRDYEGGKKGAEQLLSTPWAVAVHGELVLIAMAGTHQIWAYDRTTRVTGVYSGSGREQNYNSEDRLLAAWAQPSGLTIGGGELFIADSESSSVRAISLKSGATRTIVGGDDEDPRNLFAFGDEDGKGDAARLQHALGVLWLPNSPVGEARVVVADTYNHRLKLVDPAASTVETWVGSGVAGFESGVGKVARFSEPSGLALSPDGKQIFVADANNHAIRVVDIETQAVSTLKLQGVPAPLPAVAPRSERLADIPGAARLRTDSIAVGPGGSGKIVLRLAPPADHHYTEGAGSRWHVLAERSPVRVEESRARGALEPNGGEIVIPFRAGDTPIVGTVRVEAVAYFCKKDGACRVGAVVVEIPVEIKKLADGARVRSEVSLEHVFGDASEKLTNPLPGLPELPEFQDSPPGSEPKKE